MKCDCIDKNSFILVIGGAGFLGSAVVHELNSLGFYNIDVADDLDGDEKWRNLRPLRFRSFGSREQLEDRLKSEDALKYDCVFHFGGTCEPASKDMDALMNDYRFTIGLVNKCIQSGTKVLYASDYAVYGESSIPFSDDGRNLRSFRPLSAHAYSRYLADTTIFEDGEANLNGIVICMRISDVFGPNEYHKDKINGKSMISFMLEEHGNVPVPFWIDENGIRRQFIRDFVYVKDAAKMSVWLACNVRKSGIYNIGSGNSLSFDEIFQKTCAASDGLVESGNVGWVDWSKCGDARRYGMLDIQKIKSAGCPWPQYSFDDAIREYCWYWRHRCRLGEEVLF